MSATNKCTSVHILIAEVVKVRRHYGNKLLTSSNQIMGITTSAIFPVSLRTHNISTSGQPPADVLMSLEAIMEAGNGLDWEMKCCTEDRWDNVLTSSPFIDRLSAYVIAETRFMNRFSWRRMDTFRGTPVIWKRHQTRGYIPLNNKGNNMGNDWNIKTFPAPLENQNRGRRLAWPNFQAPKSKFTKEGNPYFWCTQKRFQLPLSLLCPKQLIFRLYIFIALLTLRIWAERARWAIYWVIIHACPQRFLPSVEYNAPPWCCIIEQIFIVLGSVLQPI